MQVVWRETSQLYDRFVSIVEVKANGVAKICYEVYRTGTADQVDCVTVESTSLDRAYNTLATVMHDPSFRGWAGYSDNT